MVFEPDLKQCALNQMDILNLRVMRTILVRIGIRGLPNWMTKVMYKDFQMGLGVIVMKEMHFFIDLIERMINNEIRT